MKKILAIVLSLCLAFSMMPFAVVAAEPEVDAHNHSHALADGDGVQANGEAVSYKIIDDAAGFTYDNWTATANGNSVTITPDATNDKITISSKDTTYTSLKNPYALTIQGNGTTLTNGTYDGSAAKTVNITPANIGAATSGHTHNYAGSSSAGGTATTAVALTTSAGSATQPVYFSGGKPSACSYTLSKSVPSNAVFTDTVTTVSSDSNSNSTTIAASTSLVYSLKNGLSKSLVSTETINIDSLSLSSGGLSTIISEEIFKSGYTLVSAKFFLRGSYAENIITSFTIGGSNVKVYNFAFYNPSDYNISAYGYVDLIYVANSL